MVEDGQRPRSRLSPLVITVKTKNPSKPMPSPLAEPDRFLDQAVARAKENVDRVRKDAVTFVRREPEKAVLSALAIGYVLRTLPILALVGFVVRLAASVAKPLAISYIAAKAFRSSTNGETAEK
jgi:soluble lytic murein transglycosylase-like protein